MASLYDEEWRQGTIFEATLPLDTVVLGEVSGQPERRMGTHDKWVVATQDCDLDQTERGDPEPSIELRTRFQRMIRRVIGGYGRRGSCSHSRITCNRQARDRWCRPPC